MGIRARVRHLVQKVRPRPHIPFDNSASYWETRYRQRGGNPGRGSCGRLADFKADVVNQLVEELDIKSIVEWGCGDGTQLGRFEVPQYIGVDVAPAAVETCRAKYANDPTKAFVTTAESVNSPPEGDMALSST